jgi:prepilin-type N-terminal cleavage/methylation domain-containing protein
MTARRHRHGYTLMELLAVVAILTALGGILVPTLSGFGGDTKVKAGADAVRARLSEARAAAIEQGRPYRVAVSEDGTRVRVAPDELGFADFEPLGEEGTTGPVIVEDALPDTVTAVPVFDEGAQAVVDEDGWVRVVTFLPDGTCREATAAVEVREPGVHAMLIRVRGLTGAATVISVPAGGALP